MKKCILALVYAVSMFIMLFGVRPLQRSCNVQRNWESKGQIYNLRFTRSRHTVVACFQRFIELTQVEAGLSSDMFFSRDKYHTDLITVQ